MARRCGVGKMNLRELDVTSCQSCIVTHDRSQAGRTCHMKIVPRTMS